MPFFILGSGSGWLVALLTTLSSYFVARAGSHGRDKGMLFLFRRGWRDGVAPHIAVGKESHGWDWKDCSFFDGMGFLPRLIAKEAYLLYIEWFRRNIESVAEL